MSRRRALLVVSAAAVAIVGVGALLLPDDGTSEAAADEDRPTTSTAVVERRDLVEQEELDGTLGYGEQTQLSLGAQGTLTGLAPEGSIVERGGTVAEVDGRAVTLWYSDRPFWRALGAEAAEGADVRQLEENLVALGFGGSLTVDDELTSSTVTAIKAWQEATGRDETGVFDPSMVVVRPGSVRVADHLSSPGAPASGPVLAVSATQRLVTVDLPASRHDLLAAGDEVEVELPDGSVAAATVYAVSSVVDAGEQGGSPTIAVTIVFDDPAGSGTLDAAPVTVRVAKTEAAGVLAVPVGALLALAEGGYAVERVDGAGTTLVGVELGAFADGFVEVTGVDEGDQLLVPS